jgi:thioredoxin 2
MNTIDANVIESDQRGLLVTCPRCGKRNRMSYERLGQTFRCGQCHNELPPPSEPVHIKDETAFDALIAHAPMLVLVDFWASWCGPCQMMAPELDRIAAEGTRRFLVAKVNTEELPGLAQRFGIGALPTLALFKSGREVARQAGAIPAAAIRQFVQKVIG